MEPLRRQSAEVEHLRTVAPPGVPRTKHMMMDLKQNKPQNATLMWSLGTNREVVCSGKFSGRSFIVVTPYVHGSTHKTCYISGMEANWT